MSKGDLIKTIQQELQRLNQEIDLRIIKGLSYAHESKRHKFLLRRLSDLGGRREREGWFTRMAHAMTMF